MTMPFGTYKYPIRPGAAAFCRAGAANAGNIASRNGSATVAPRPRSAVRRDNFLMTPPLRSSPHPERTAVHDPDHQCAEPVIVVRALSKNLIHSGPVRSFQSATNGKRQEFLGKVAREGRSVGLQDFLQAFRACKRSAVGQRPGAVDVEIAILCAPRA